MIKKFFSRGYVFLVLAFIYIPIFILILYSFNSGKTIGVWEGFDLKWYFKLGEVKDVVINTVVLALVSATIATILGTLGAIGIFYSKGKLGRSVNLFSQIPVVNSEVVTACALVMLLMLLGFSNRSIFGLYIGHIILITPFVVLSVMPKLKQMDNNLYEAALDLGATPTRALFSVVIPQISPGIVAGFMLAITLSLDDYVIAAYTKPNTFQTISTHIYSLAKGGTVNTIKSSYWAFTAIIFLLIVIVVITMNVIAHKKAGKKS